MGMSPSGILSYGYDLGGVEGEWNFKNLNSDGEPNVPWWPKEDEESVDIPDRIDTLLLASIGFTETNWSESGFWERKREAQSRLGLDTTANGSDYYSGILLVTWHASVSWGETSVINFDKLNVQRLDEDWDGKLDRALEILGLEPEADHAQWLLATYYG